MSNLWIYLDDENYFTFDGDNYYPGNDRKYSNDKENVQIVLDLKENHSSRKKFLCG